MFSRPRTTTSEWLCITASYYQDTQICRNWIHIVSPNERAMARLKNDVELESIWGLIMIVESLAKTMQMRCQKVISVADFS